MNNYEYRITYKLNMVSGYEDVTRRFRTKKGAIKEYLNLLDGNMGCGIGSIAELKIISIRIRDWKETDITGKVNKFISD